MDLRYDCISAYYSGINEHPQKVMKDLGISYKNAVPQSLGDQWWFFDVETSNDDLPPYLTELALSESVREYWKNNRSINEKTFGY